MLAHLRPRLTGAMTLARFDRSSPGPAATGVRLGARSALVGDGLMIRKSAARALATGSPWCSAERWQAKSRQRADCNALDSPILERIRAMEQSLASTRGGVR